MDIIKILQEISPIIVAVCTITITIFAIMAYKKIDPNQDRTNKIRALSEFRKYFEKTNLTKLVSDFIFNRDNMSISKTYIKWKKADSVGLTDSLDDNTKRIIRTTKCGDFFSNLDTILLKIHKLKIFMNIFELEKEEYVSVYRFEISIIGGIITEEMVEVLRAELSEKEMFSLQYKHTIDSFIELKKLVTETNDKIYNPLPHG